MRESATKKYWEEKGKIDLRKNKPLTPVESGFPIRSITIDLTKKCNLRCDYCFTNLSRGKYCAPDLTEEMGKKIIDWLLKPEVNGNADKVDITFWGGEPLLKWEMLKKLVLYAEERGKEVGTKVTFNGTTNVTLLTPEKFDFMDEHGVHFLLSVDGIKEHHDTHRKFPDGSGSWEVVDKNLNAILERWPNYQVRLSYSTETIENFIEDIKYLYNKGVKRIAYSPVCEGDWNEQKIIALNDSWMKIAEFWSELYKKGDPIYIKYINDFIQRLFISEGNRPPCGAGRGYVGIATDGAIYPCHRFNKFDDPRPWYEREVCIGHIDYGILNQEFRENFIKWDIYKDMKESCKECPAFEQFCNGGCWASNWDLEGALNGTPIASCETTLANIKVAKKLIEEFPELGDKFKKRKQGKSTVPKIPLAQGCQCYNVEDILWGRKTVNKHDPHSCLCNMAVYGEQPKEVTRCDCYNVEDSFMSHYDKTGSQCGRFTIEKEASRDPLTEAIKYLRDENLKLEKLTQEEKKKIAEFGKLLQENAKLKKEIDESIEK